MTNLLREYINELILAEANSAYDKYDEFDRKWGKSRKPSQSSNDLLLMPNFVGEKKQIFTDVVRVLRNYMNLTDAQIKKIAFKIQDMGPNDIYFLKSYLSRGHRGWNDIKHILMPGFG